MADFDGAVLNGIENLQARHDLARGKGLNLELAVSRLGHVFGKGLASAVDGVERFWPACRQSPSDLRRRLGNGRRSERRDGHASRANFEKFTAFHGHVSSLFKGQGRDKPAMAVRLCCTWPSAVDRHPSGGEDE